MCVCVRGAGVGFKNKSAKHRNIYIKKYVVCLTSKSVVYFCFRALDAKESKSTKQATNESHCCCYVAKLKKRQKKKDCFLISVMQNGRQEFMMEIKACLIHSTKKATVLHLHTVQYLLRW